MNLDGNTPQLGDLQYTFSQPAQNVLTYTFLTLPTVNLEYIYCQLLKRSSSSLSISSMITQLKDDYIFIYSVQLPCKYYFISDTFILVITLKNLHIRVFQRPSPV